VTIREKHRGRGVIFRSNVARDESGVLARLSPAVLDHCRLAT